jgi:hypothetical protein
MRASTVAPRTHCRLKLKSNNKHIVARSFTLISQPIKSALRSNRTMDPRPNRAQVTQSNDCYVDPNGVMFLTDQNAGLYILQSDGQR